MPAMQQQSENCKRAYTRIFSLRNSLCGCSRAAMTCVSEPGCGSKLLLVASGQ